MIQSRLFSHLGIVHGYSTRTERKEKFFGALGVNREDLVIGQQVHGVRIAKVSDTNKGKTLPGIDGLISKNLPIGVTFADCVPILAVDLGSKIIGTAHAGWKGTLKGIARELITVMKKAGADTRNIYVSIGPHIGMCCYNVLPDRAQAFQKQFGNDERIASRVGGEWHLDLGYANYQTLCESGIQKEHIDAPVTCTSCQADLFTSFRKDLPRRIKGGPDYKFVLQLGVIAL